MSEKIDEIVQRIVRDIRSEKPQCLESFLYEIADLCGADEGGIVSITGADIKLLASGGAVQSFTTIKPFLQADIQNWHDLRSPTNYILQRWIGSLKKNTVLGRVWPPANWNPEPNQLYWFYLLNPKSIIAPKSGVLRDDLIALFSVLSAYFSRLNEDFGRQNECLDDKHLIAQTKVRAIERLIIRPVMPSHFHSILSKFIPFSPSSDTLADPFEWAGNIDVLTEACKKPKHCNCHHEDEGAGHRKPTNFRCPQTMEIDHVLDILSKLELWRTGFWKAEWKDQKDKRKKLLDDGLEGLWKAGNALRWSDVERKHPIDFASGAVGLPGERLLLRHFVADAIQQARTKFKDKWKNENASSLDLQFPAKLANLAATLLGDGKWTPEAIENLSQVMAFYGHHVLDIPLRMNLARHLDQTQRGEASLQTLKVRYRDHFFHTLEVCLLGYAILKSRPNKANPMTFGAWLLKQGRANRKTRARKERLPNLPKNEEELLAQYWVAALVHDTAYGIDVFSGTLKLLDFFTNRKEIEDFVGKAQNSVKDMAEHLSKMAPELQDDASLKKGDHGVIAAASLAELLKKMGKQTAKRFEPAVRAIAFHNTQYPAIDAGVDPIAALLILCDTVQEWGRSSLGFDHSPSMLLSRMMEAAAAPKEEQFGPVKRFGLSFKPGSAPGDFVWRTAKEFKIALDYGDEHNKGCKALFTWAEMTYNLQRVNFEPWNVKLSIHVSVPIPQTMGDKHTAPKSQFELFADFVQERQVRFLENWIRTALAGDASKAVCHTVEEIAGASRDIITFNLQELSKEFVEERPLMSGHAGNFEDAIKTWIQFAHEQDENLPLHGRLP